MDTTKEKCKHYSEIILSKVNKLDPDITDKYYVKEIYLQLPKATPFRLYKIFEIFFLVSFLLGVSHGLFFYSKPI